MKGFWNDIIISFSKRQNEQKTKINLKNLSFLSPYLKKHRKKFMIVFLVLILNSILVLPAPAITGYIVDKVFINKDLAELNMLVFLLIIILFISNIGMSIQEYYSMNLTQEFTYSIRGDLLDRILKLPMTFFDNFQTGYLVSRLEEISFLGGFFSTSVLLLLGNFFKFFGVLFFLFRFNEKLTLVSLIALPLFYIISKRCVSGIRTSSIDAMEKGAKVREKIQETLSGIELIKSFSREKKETVKIKNYLRKLLKFEIVQRLVSLLSNQMLAIISGLNLLIILWISGYEIISDKLTVGEYVAFVGYIGYIYSPIQTLAATFFKFQQALMASKRVSEFLHIITEDEHPKRIHDLKKIRGKIEFQKVHFSYGDGNEVLNDVSFSVREGENIAIVGASGTGKSTLINMILGLYGPTKGKILIDDIDIGSIKLKSLRERVGVVSQNVFLFNDTILNNIRYSDHDAPLEKVEEAAIVSGAHKFIINLPKGYDTNVGEIGKKLSGGEKQRISIARAVLKQPDIIILDEPIAHLDNISIKILYNSIKQLIQNKTCVIISHRLSNIDWVDRIFVLESGKIVQEGCHDELMKLKDRYYKLFISE